jgi:hypothetical protein
MIWRRALLCVVFVPAGTVGEVLVYHSGEAGTLAMAAALGESRLMGAYLCPEAS